METEYSTGEKLIPLDNFLRRLMIGQKIIIGRTAPFITGVMKESIELSTIQNRTKEPIETKKTQVFCTLLRERLSTLRKEYTSIELVKLILSIAKANPSGNPEAIDHEITNILAKYAIDNQVLRYIRQERLKDEADNEQKYDSNNNIISAQAINGF